jgi:uncharacterized lipoprotein NlpE involved in copper resistance
MKRIVFITTCLLLLTLAGCNNKPNYYAKVGDFILTQSTSDDVVFTKVFNEAKDNYTINITSGTYTITIPLISNARNLLIEGDVFNPPTIKGFAFIAGNDGWIFRNLIFQDSIGIDMSNSKNWVLENVTINGVTYNETGSGLGSWEKQNKIIQ